MKKILYLGTIGLLFMACSQNPAETENQEDATAVLTEPKIVKIDLANFDTEAGNYVAKEVEVTGIVDHICKHGGKKLLLVVDGAQVHINADERFDEELIGNTVGVRGIVSETVIDEGKCLEMEEDNIASHKEGESNDDNFELKKKQIQTYRDSMAVAGLDHLSFYSLDFVSFTEE